MRRHKLTNLGVLATLRAYWQKREILEGANKARRRTLQQKRAADGTFRTD